MTARWGRGVGSPCDLSFVGGGNAIYRANIDREAWETFSRNEIFFLKVQGSVCRPSFSDSISKTDGGGARKDLFSHFQESNQFEPQS